MTEHNSLLQLLEKNKLKKIPTKNYEADTENTQKSLPPATTKPRKSKQIDVNSEQETSDTSKSSETEHLSAFEDMISD